MVAKFLTVKSLSSFLATRGLRAFLMLMTCLGAVAMAWAQTAATNAATSANAAVEAAASATSSGLDWASLLSGGAVVAVIGLLLSYIARPTAQTIKDLRTDLNTLRGEIHAVRIVVAELRASNTHLRVVFTALSSHYNQVRAKLLEANPALQILTIPEIVAESQVPLQQVGILDHHATPIQRPTP